MAEVFSKDPFSTQLHSSVLTSRLLHRYSLSQTLPDVTSLMLLEYTGISLASGNHYRDLRSLS